MNTIRKNAWILTGFLLGTVVVLFFTTRYRQGPQTRTDQVDQTDAQRPQPAEIPRAKRTALRADYFHRLYRDPKTDRVPADMHLRNRAFIQRLRATAAYKSQQQIIWEEAGPNNVGGRTRALALDQRDSDVILTGGVRGGLWKSIDGGTTWRHATGLTQNESITSIAQHPLVPDTWYAATGEFVGSGANFGGGGLYASRDNGASWDLYRYARAFEADPRRTRYERIFDDRITSAFSELDDNPFLYSSRIAVSPTTGTAFVATHGWGLLRSTDDLATFDHALPGLPQQVTRKELEADEETLLLLHFNDTPDGVDGEAPTSTPTLDYEEGVFGQGAYLGTGDHLTFTSDGNINGQQGTLEFWIKPRWDGNDGGENDFLLFGPIPSAVFIHRVFGGVEVIVNLAGAEGNPQVGASAGVEDWVADAWRHVAFTWDETAVRTYIDGQLRTESAITFALPEITSATFDIGSPNPNVPVDAVLDEVRLSGVARSPEEILESYLSGAEDDTVPLPDHRPRFSEIAVDQAGNLLAYVSGSLAEGAGVYYSRDDGLTWADHTPADFPAFLGRAVVALAPSNPDVVYVLLETANGLQPGVRFFKLDLAQKTAEDRSANVPFFRFPDTGGGFGLNAFAYNMLVSVKPDDEEFIVIGGILLARSQDGLATAPDDLLENYIQGGTHVDHHLAVFDPQDPNALWLTNDGGVYKTEDITRTSSQLYATVQWIDKNIGYNVTQFYTVALHPRVGDNRIMGGTQDNGTPVMDRGASRDPVPSLGDAFGGDGGFAFFGEQHGYVSAQLGEVYRLGYDANGKPSFDVNWTDLTPGRGRGQLGLHPFILDPNDEDVIYYPLQNKVLRHTTITSIPEFTVLPPEDWESLDQVAAPEGSLLTAINVSTAPADVLYYADHHYNQPPSIYRLEEARTATTGVEKVTIPEAEAGTWVRCIAINPDDADEILVVISNYNVVSLFHSTDGGQTYQTVEGNLAGDAMLPGPTMDWADMLTFNGQTYYFVATSIGVFMTQDLDGDNTVWTLQGEDVIGYALAKMIRSRASDGLIAVATHGRGIFVGYPDTGGEPTALTVWPGDTNNDKTVNGGDVLPLGFHFGRTGPARAAAERGCAFQAFSVPFWTPEAATSADANGDGTVNGGDVLCIGFNFGKTHAMARGGIAAKTVTPPADEAVPGRLTLRLLEETDETIWATVYAEEVEDLLGAAFSLVYRAEAFEAVAVERGAWLGQDVLWQDDVDADAGAVGIGVSRKAIDGGVSGTGVLARVRLEKKDPSADLESVGLEQATASVASGVMAKLSVSSEELPEAFVVRGNYPNPFNPTTTIVFDLPASAQVSVLVYDMLGRQVLVLPSQAMAPGAQHRVRLDASSLASGTYFYRVRARMEAETQIQTGRMLLIK